MSMYGYWQDTAEKICDGYAAGSISRDDAEKRLVSMGIMDADDWLDAALMEHRAANSQFGVGA